MTDGLPELTEPLPCRSSPLRPELHPPGVLRPEEVLAPRVSGRLERQLREGRLPGHGLPVSVAPLRKPGKDPLRPSLDVPAHRRWDSGLLPRAGPGSQQVPTAFPPPLPLPASGDQDSLPSHSVTQGSPRSKVLAEGLWWLFSPGASRQSLSLNLSCGP